MGTLNRAVMMMAAVLGLSAKNAMHAADEGIIRIPSKDTHRSDNHSEARRCRGYGGNRSSNYLNYTKFGGAQEIARRKAKHERRAA